MVLEYRLVRVHTIVGSRTHSGKDTHWSRVLKTLFGNNKHYCKVLEKFLVNLVNSMCTGLY